jgi:hypothetical protein
MWKKKNPPFRRSRPGGGGREAARPPPQHRAVGTEAAARANLERNARLLSYPPEGFETKVEYGLLYSLLTAPPGTYPDRVVASAVAREDFGQYLPVAAPAAAAAAAAATRADPQDDPEQRCSFAQLSALLVAASESFAGDPVAAPPGQQGGTGGERDGDAAAADTVSVPQALCRALIRTAVRHAERNDLDRAECVRELMDPVQRLASDRTANQTLLQVLPMYVGLGASILTGNPLPMYLGYAGSVKMAVDTSKEIAKLQDLVNAADRAADAEKASLLDEAHGGDEDGDGA